MDDICDYGCGQEAEYEFSNGKVCCSENHASCPGVVTGPKNGSNWNENDLEKIWDECDSISEVVKTLYGTVGGGNHATVKRVAKKLGYDVKEKKNQYKAFGPGPRPDRRTSLSEILNGEHPKYSTNRLKKRLFENEIKKRKCENCGVEKWQGKEVPLELHHMNGDSNDHRIDNLEVLCPNCHAQTDNYRKKE